MLSHFGRSCGSSFCANAIILHPGCLLGLKRCILAMLSLFLSTSPQSDHALCGWNDGSNKPQRDGAVALYALWELGEYTLPWLRRGVCSSLHFPLPAETQPCLGATLAQSKIQKQKQHHIGTGQNDAKQCQLLSSPELFIRLHVGNKQKGLWVERKTHISGCAIEAYLHPRGCL